MKSDEVSAELSALFSEFLPYELATRYCTALELKPHRWHQIDPWMTWHFVGPSGISEWHDGGEALLCTEPFCRLASSPVAVLRCGHDRAALERVALRDALVGDRAVCEGFVSVTPGQLGLAINHDGGICVMCRQETPADQ